MKLHAINSNAGGLITSNAGAAVKGFHTFAANDTPTMQEIVEQLKEERLRRDNAALRLPPMPCGCRDPLRCRCR